MKSVAKKPWKQITKIHKNFPNILKHLNAFFITSFLESIFYINIYLNLKSHRLNAPPYFSIGLLLFSILENLNFPKYILKKIKERYSNLNSELK